MHKNPFIISLLVAVLIFTGFSLAKKTNKTASEENLQTKSEITIKSVSLEDGSVASVASAAWR
jgi:archaellin